MAMRAKVAAAFDSDESGEESAGAGGYPPMPELESQDEEKESGEEEKADSVIATPGTPPKPHTSDEDFIDDGSDPSYEPSEESEEMELTDSGVSDDADYRQRMQLARRSSMEETANSDEEKPADSEVDDEGFSTRLIYMMCLHTTHTRCLRNILSNQGKPLLIMTKTTTFSTTLQRKSRKFTPRVHSKTFETQPHVSQPINNE